LNARGHNIITFSRALKLLGFTLLLWLAYGQPVSAQNTKGDRPPQNRESRFKTPFKKSKSSKNQKVVKAKRVRSTDKSVAGRANSSSPRRRASGVDRPGKPIRPIVRNQPSNKQKAWRGDIAGRKIRAGSTAGSSRKNVYPQYGRYVHNPHKKPRAKDKPVSNKDELVLLQGLQSAPNSIPPKKRKLTPRSASSSFTARKSINVYANFKRPKKRGEHATTKDLAGRPLRRKNFESPRPGVTEPLFKPYYHRKPMGDKPGKVQGGYRTATRPGGRAWQGDIAGRKIRGRNFSSKKSVEGQPTLPSRRNKGERFGDRAYRGKHGWYQTATQSGETRPGKGPLPAKTPGIGASGIEKYKGSIKGQRPLKGGGSVSGRLWNNKGQAIEGKTPTRQDTRVVRFQGNARARRPLTGGGSVSGRLWNNKGQPIAGRAGTQEDTRNVTYQGNVRAKRPVKGGGNNGALPRKAMPEGAERVSGYPGKMKRFSVQPGFGDMGETFTGYVKLKKFRKNYIQNPNASDESIKKKRPSKSSKDADGMYAKVKRPPYTENKNSADEALLKLKPSKTTYQAGELQVRVKEKEYRKKPHSAEGSLPGIKPTKSSVKASEYARSVKRNWDYIHNPSSADEALKTKEPGKAFGKSAAYQGNIKMQKFVLFEKNRRLHPDSKFVKTNKNNVDDERDALTGFKLWWARVFKKQEAQPEHLKYKGKKPRYDKGEEGMWYE
jgi:hypothetical protein